MNFGARRWPQAEACSRTEDGTDRSITVTRHSVGPIGAKHRDHVWNSCCEPHLGSGHVRPHQQTGHMAAIASIRNRIPPLACRGPSTYGSRLKAGTTKTNFRFGFQTADRLTHTVIADTGPRSRGTLRPRFARKSSPSKIKRAQGMPDARCTRDPVRNGVVVARTSIQGSGGNPTFPAQWLYGL